MFEAHVGTQHLYDVADGFARGDVNQKVVDALRMGRMTAIQKEDGGVGGVVGDVFWRVVARTMAIQFSGRCEATTVPFQFALSTRAGCECLTHVMRGATGIDDRTFTMSVDGIGAYDWISRNRMFASLHRIVDRAQMIPFGRLLCGSLSVH